MSKFWYIAVEKHSPESEGVSSWGKYIEWSKLHHLAEVISLDSHLCPPIIDIADDDWDYVINEDYFIHFFTNLDWLKSKLIGKKNFNLLAVKREPELAHEMEKLPGFEMVGYDLVDRRISISALTNCGGFDESFLPQDLNKYGLIDEKEKAFDIRKRLLGNNPEEEHADCWVFEIRREIK